MGSSRLPASPVATALFGKARRAVLALLLGRPDERFHVRGIGRMAGVGSGAVQRELRVLAEAGIVERRDEGRQVYYQANPRCPVFGELRAIVAKTVGVADRAMLGPVGGITDDRADAVGATAWIRRKSSHFATQKSA